MNMAYHRTPSVYIGRMFHSISKRIRNKPTYQNRKLLFNLKEFRKWVDDNQSTFNKLYKAWVRSGYLLKLAPSLDRIDNKGDYTLQNIRLITVSQNVKYRLQDYRVMRSKVKSKVCTKCKKIKPITSFYTDKRAADKRKSECAKCHRLYPDLRPRKRKAV